MSTTTYLSAVTYDNAAGGFTDATDFVIPFPYLLPEHVRVYRNGVGMTRPSGWDFLDDGTVRLAVPAVNGDVIVVRRKTRLDARMVNYNAGSNLGEEDLNIVTKQLLYLIQEIQDERAAADDGTGGLPDGAIDDPDFIDALATEILQRQTFQNLIALVPLMDQNAEIIVREILRNHEQWSLHEQREAQFGLIDNLVGQHGAAIEEFTRLIDEGDLVGVDVFNAIVARMGDAESAIIANDSVRASEDAALATSLDFIGARVDDAEGSITSLQTAGALQDSAIASLTTEVNARVPLADFENVLAESSYIQGIQTHAGQLGASINGIESYLVGTGDFTTPEPGSAVNTLSALQTTVTGHASQLGTELLFRQQMVSRFGGDVSDPNTFIAAMQSEWQTYADESSTSANRLDSLEVNQRPIYFGTSPPNPTQVLNHGVDAWAQAGFPDGSMWFKQISTTAGQRWRLRPFVYRRASLNGAEVAALDEYYSFNRTSDNAFIGGWMPATDDALNNELGAKIEETQEVIIGTNGSLADFRTRLQAIYGPSITNVEQWLEAYIRPPEDPEDPSSGGIMYSGWGVRMNQYHDGTPVIAGVGLGVQSDPFNPEATSVSDFIVMADNFAVIAPPAGDDLTANPDLSSIRVPFIIDSQTGEVGIDGNLTVTGSLKAYSGGLKDIAIGRATFGQLDANLDLVNPTGYRMHLMSSTENYWRGTDGTDFLVWAGNGTMNKNNAKLWIDKNGNAGFAGTVQADNVNGNLSNLEPITMFYSPALTTSDEIFDYFGTWTCTPDHERQRRGAAFIALQLHGTAGRGEAVLEMRRETGLNSGNWSAWDDIAYNNHQIGISSYLTFGGSMSGTANGRYQIRVGFRRPPGTSGTVELSQVTGYLMAV